MDSSRPYDNVWSSSSDSVTKLCVFQERSLLSTTDDALAIPTLTVHGSTYDLYLQHLASIFTNCQEVRVSTMHIAVVVICSSSSSSSSSNMQFIRRAASVSRYHCLARKHAVAARRHSLTTPYVTRPANSVFRPASFSAKLSR